MQLIVNNTVYVGFINLLLSWRSRTVSFMKNLLSVCECCCWFFFFFFFFSNTRNPKFLLCMQTDYLVFELRLAALPNALSGETFNLPN
jgi:hypothetical protein